MKTYEISRDEIKGLEPIAEGYKAIKYDGGTKQDFKYCEKGENLIGRIFKVDGDISACAWGLHFSKDPADVLNFYNPLGYNRYFKVRAYEKVIDCLDGLKSVAQCIEFCEEYDVLDYIELIKMFDRPTNAVIDSNAVNYSDTVRCSDAVNSSVAVNGSDAVSDSNAVIRSEAVSGSDAVRRSSAVSGSSAVVCSDAVCRSNAVRCSYAVNCSDTVSDSSAVTGSSAVVCSDTVSDSSAVSYSSAVVCSDAVRRSDAVRSSNAVNCSNSVSCSNAVSCSVAVSESYGLRECEAIKFGIFCYKKEGAKYVAFNKKITKNRFEEIYQRIRGFGFYPHFDNFYDLRGDKEWRTIAFPELVGVDNKTAWSKMPKEMRDYIESLPEYDEKIFNAIIG